MTTVRYNVVPVDDGGYRVFAMSPKTGKWEDCQSLFGNGSLWVTYPTKAEAERVAKAFYGLIASVKDDYLTSVDQAFNATQKEFDPSDF